MQSVNNLNIYITTEQYFLRYGISSFVSNTPPHWPTLTMSVLATLQPRVPAPSKRHFVFTTLSRSKEGTSRQRISFRFKSTDDSASLHTVSGRALESGAALCEPMDNTPAQQEITNSCY